MLVACATTSPALSESQELLAQGKLDEALVRLELALRENPNNAELRLAVAQTREKIMGRQVQKMQEQLRQDNKRQQEPEPPPASR